MNNKMDKKIKLDTRKSDNLMTKAYEIIKENICDNTIEPGTLLSESQIAKELGMSRTPVREALKVLSLEGMVEIHLGIGAYVKPITYKEFRDLYEVRKALEVVAARTAINKISKEQVCSLEDKFNDLLRRHRNKENVTIQEFSKVDLAVHEMIIDNCDNDYIKSFMNNVISNVRRIQSISFSAINDLEESTKQHIYLLELINEGDYDKLADAIRKHIDWSADSINFF